MYVVALDGVMRSATGVPIRDGVHLFDSLLRSGTQVVIASDTSIEETSRWLRHNGISHDEILGNEKTLADVDLRLHQVRMLRARGAYIQCVFEPDPHRALPILAEGVSVSVFGHPTFTRPNHRFTRPKAEAWSRLISALNQRQGIPDEDV